MTREILKQNAKEQIRDKIGILIVMYLIVIGVIFIANSIPMAGYFANVLLLSPAFSVSLIMVYFKVCDYQEIKVGDIFEGFYHFWGAFKIIFLVNLFSSLWSLLFIIPGIVKGYSYSMALYIWTENKEMGALEAISRSKEIMEGHKMDLFVLQLSFIGWYLLTFITFGIAAIYVVPYIDATMVNFYRSINN